MIQCCGLNLVHEAKQRSSPYKRLIHPIMEKKDTTPRWWGEWRGDEENDSSHPLKSGKAYEEIDFSSQGRTIKVSFLPEKTMRPKKWPYMLKSECFICTNPHAIKNHLKLGSFMKILEDTIEESSKKHIERMNSLQLFNTIKVKTKTFMIRRGLMFHWCTPQW